MPADSWAAAAVAGLVVQADPRVGVRAVAVHDLRGSDHRPLLAELTLPT